jgi:hypothetical protein
MLKSGGPNVGRGTRVVRSGKRAALTAAQVKRIRQVLVARGAPGLRDLALFQVAIDTMLHGPDLFNLTVKEVRLPKRQNSFSYQIARRGGMSPVRCAFSKTTAAALGKWIAVSGAKRGDYLFPGRGSGSRRPMGVRPHEPSAENSGLPRRASIPRSTVTNPYDGQRPSTF